MIAAGLASLLLASAFAQDVSTAPTAPIDKIPASSPYARLSEGAEIADRERACAELAVPPERGDRAYQTLAAIMAHDLSHLVRLAAARAAITYPGGRTLAAVESFLKSEPGDEVRRRLIVALSTEPAHLDNPEATRIIAVTLAEDASPDVRIAAAGALAAREDFTAVGPLRRAISEDENKAVREAARRALVVVMRPPKPKDEPKQPDPPKPNAVFGKDPCPRPWGWCECSGAVTIKPRCLTASECKSFKHDMRRNGLICKWDGGSNDN